MEKGSTYYKQTANAWTRSDNRVQGDWMSWSWHPATPSTSSMPPPPILQTPVLFLTPLSMPQPTFQTPTASRHEALASSPTPTAKSTTDISAPPSTPSSFLAPSDHGSNSLSILMSVSWGPGKHNFWFWICCKRCSFRYISKACPWSLSCCYSTNGEHWSDEEGVTNYWWNCQGQSLQQMSVNKLSPYSTNTKTIFQKMTSWILVRIWARIEWRLLSLLAWHRSFTRLG